MLFELTRNVFKYNIKQTHSRTKHTRIWFDTNIHFNKYEENIFNNLLEETVFDVNVLYHVMSFNVILDSRGSTKNVKYVAPEGKE